MGAAALAPIPPASAGRRSSLRAFGRRGWGKTARCRRVRTQRRPARPVAERAPCPSRCRAAASALPWY
eukprot:2235896-Prymnesium_polylepis.1